MTDRWETILGGAAILGLVVIVGLTVRWFIDHPCLEEKRVPATCGGDLTCTYRDDKHGCMAWSRQPEYACEHVVCVRRAP